MATATADNVTVKETIFREVTAITESWGWARVLMEESTGRVVIISDHGEWSYCWTSIGDRSLAEFLNKLDWHYMGNKMLGSRLMKHDDAGTIKKIRDQIIEYRKDGTLNKDKAREEWEYAKQYEDGWGDFRWWCEQTKFFSDCSWEHSTEEPVGYWMTFWNHIWTPLIKPALAECG